METTSHILDVLAGTGIRVGELANLQISDIDEEAEKIRISPAKSPFVRYIPLCEPAGKHSVPFARGAVTPSTCWGLRPNGVCGMQLCSFA